MNRRTDDLKTKLPPGVLSMIEKYDRHPTADLIKSVTFTRTQIDNFGVKLELELPEGAYFVSQKVKVKHYANKRYCCTLKHEDLNPNKFGWFAYDLHPQKCQLYYGKGECHLSVKYNGGKDDIRLLIGAHDDKPYIDCVTSFRKALAQEYGE